MSEPDALIDRLVAATRAERRAREELREALGAQAQVLRELREVGVPASRVAHRIARALGIVLPIDARRRLAATLRKRRSRALRRGTDGHGDPVAAPATRPLPALPSDRAFPFAAHQK